LKNRMAGVGRKEQALSFSALSQKSKGVPKKHDPKKGRLMFVARSYYDANTRVKSVLIHVESDLVERDFSFF